MIRSLRLQNYKSLGLAQTSQLEAITVVVGANNSGKSNFLRFVDVFAPEREGSTNFPFEWHRSPQGDGSMIIEWTSDLGPHREGLAEYSFRATRPKNGPVSFEETVSIDGGQVFVNAGGIAKLDNSHLSGLTGIVAPFVFKNYPNHPRAQDFRRLFSPVIHARRVHLSIEALRSDSYVAPNLSLAFNGVNLAAMIAFWLLEEPEQMERFNTIIAKCLPEMRRVHARSVAQGQVRLYFEQKDGERFDATEVSEGVLVFAGLIAHALEAPSNGLVLLEEPERGIHPRRLGELVDLLRMLVEERNTQFILATHSPALLNHFRDEPEAVLTFRRGANGTLITRLSDLPDVADTLARADPGELLVSGAFNEGEYSDGKSPSAKKVK